MSGQSDPIISSDIKISDQDEDNQAFDQPQALEIDSPHSQRSQSEEKYPQSPDNIPQSPTFFQLLRQPTVEDDEGLVEGKRVMDSLRRVVPDDDNGDMDEDDDEHPQSKFPLFNKTFKFLILFLAALIMICVICSNQLSLIVLSDIDVDATHRMHFLFAVALCADVIKFGLFFFPAVLLGSIQKLYFSHIFYLFIEASIETAGEYLFIGFVLPSLGAEYALFVLSMATIVPSIIFFLNKNHREKERDKEKDREKTCVGLQRLIVGSSPIILLVIAMALFLEHPKDFTLFFPRTLEALSENQSRGIIILTVILISFKWWVNYYYGRLFATGKIRRTCCNKNSKHWFFLKPREYAADVVDTLRYETAMIHSCFKIILIVAGIAIYAQEQGYAFRFVWNGVFVNGDADSIKLRTALVTYFLSSLIAYTMMQITGRIGVVRACAYPNIISPLLTYLIIRFRRGNYPPEYLRTFFNFLLSPLVGDGVNHTEGETWDNIIILFLLCLSSLILGWEGMRESADIDHFERSLWNRAEGPGLFINLNFLLNRNRDCPNKKLEQTKPPKTILFMNTCYYAEALEELTGSIKSIRNSVESWNKFRSKEVRKHQLDKEYAVKYKNRHLEVHLAVDTVFKDPDRGTLEAKELNLTQDYKEQAEDMQKEIYERAKLIHRKVQKQKIQKDKSQVSIRTKKKKDEDDDDSTTDEETKDEEAENTRKDQRKAEETKKRQEAKKKRQERSRLTRALTSFRKKAEKKENRSSMEEDSNDNLEGWSEFIEFDEFEEKKKEEIKQEVKVEEEEELEPDENKKQEEEAKKRDFFKHRLRPFFSTMVGLMEDPKIWGKCEKPPQCIQPTQASGPLSACKDYGVEYVYRFGKSKHAPKLYISFKDGKYGAFTGTKRLSMCLYFREIQKRIPVIAMEKGWVNEWIEEYNVKHRKWKKDYEKENLKWRKSYEAEKRKRDNFRAKQITTITRTAADIEKEEKRFERQSRKDWNNGELEKKEGYKNITPKMYVAQEINRLKQNCFVFTADGDTLYSPESVRLLHDYILRRPNLTGVCGTVAPIGDGPLALFQKFEYCSAHIFNKVTEFMLGTVLCLPGCYSIYRFSDLEPVLPKYAQGCTQSLDLLQRQQGEDRWLTTLLTLRGCRLGYFSLATSLTHCPTDFDVLFKQRRRWITSTFANLWILLSHSEHEGSNRLQYMQFMFLAYAFINFISAIVSPAMVAILVTGGVSSFGLPLSVSLLIGILPPIIFSVICIIYDNAAFVNKQLYAAKMITFIYVFLVGFILIGLLRVCIFAPLSPGSLFLLGYALSFISAAILHNKLTDITCGIVYLFLIPTMYQILIIFSFFNFNDISWGTREADEKHGNTDPIHNFFQNILEQQFLGWMFSCWKNKKNNNKKEEEETKKPILKTAAEEEAKLIEDEKTLQEKKEKEEKEKMKKIQEVIKERKLAEKKNPLLKQKIEIEKTWLAYLFHKGLELDKRKKEKGIIQVSVDEAAIKRELTSIKYNVLWCVAAANVIFFAVIVALSSMTDFNVFGTGVNAFSLFLLLLFGFVQLIQTICMMFDGVKSLARRMSYLDYHED